MTGHDQPQPGQGLSRRRFLSMTSAVAAAGVLAAACGSDTGRGPSSSGGGPTTSGGSGSSPTGGAPVSSGGTAPTGGASTATSASGTGGAKPSLAQWYHAYGEDGTEAAVKRYAASYPNATVTVGWFPGDYDSKVAASLLTASGPDVFESGNGPNIDQIQGGQVVALDGILGDAADDFTASMIDRMTYDGHLYAVPQVIDMQLMVYRKSMLDKAGVKPPTTFDELVDAARKLTTKDVKGLFVGNDGGVSTLVGPTLWSVGADYLTKDNKPGFTSPDVATALGKLHELFTSGSLLLGAPTDWSDPSAINQGLCAMQWTGLWTFPALQQALGDDFGMLPWPKFSASGPGAPSVPIGAYGSCVSAKSKDVDAAQSFVKWLWVDNTADQLDFAQSYGFHIPSRKSVAAKADKLRTGAAADAVQILQQDGHAQTPLLWTPKAGSAMSDAVTKIIKSGADPAAELAGVLATTQAELDRVLKK